MNIFNRKTKTKHILEFEQRIAELLKEEMPQLKKVLGFAKPHGISFMQKPKGIFFMKGYNPKEFEELKKNHKTYFYLNGISVFNRKSEAYQPIKLIYNFDRLTIIEIDNPEYFHKTFDLNQIRKIEVSLEHLKMENPDQKIAEKALKSLSEEQMSLLELENTFEIELNEKLFYTILDMEDGNYIAVDKKGKIYRLNHDHEEIVKLIASKPVDFFEFYNGQKSDLEV